MGVKIKELIDRRSFELSSLSGKIAAIDAPNLIMSLFTFALRPSSERDASLITDRTQRVISHLYGLLYRVNFYYNKNIFPIFCFDGRDSELKRITTKDYLNDFRFAQRLYREALERNDKNAAKQIALSKEFLWPNVITESKHLLSAMGVPIVSSGSSAEAQCAHLVKEKIADFAISQDFDSLLFGCPVLVQNLSKTQKRKVKGRWIYQKILPLGVNLEENLKRLGINQFQLVDAAILIGTDYFPGIDGIGCKKALELVRKYQSLERVIEQTRQIHDFSKVNYNTIKQVRKIFLLPEVINIFDGFCWTTPDKSRLLSFLCQDHSLNRERVETNIDKLINNYITCRRYFKEQRLTPKSIQTTLDAIFANCNIKNQKKCINDQ